MYLFFRLGAILMLPIISGGHSAYQDTFVSDLLKYYPNPFALPKSIWEIITQFWYLDLSLADTLMQDCYAKYGRTVHTYLSDDPRIFNIPPRDSEEWKKEYDRRASVERSNKREKNDYLLEAGKHRSTKMWYCHLYGIMMLQHLDAWEMPSLEDFQKSIALLIA